MKAKVVIDASPVFNTSVGIGRTTSRFIESLQDFTTPFEYVFFARRMLGKPLKSALLLDCKTSHLRMPRFSEPIIARLNLIELLCRGDLYHATDFYLPIGRKTHAKLVATIHDLIFENAPEQMVDHIRLARWTPSFARRCDRIISPSAHSKADIVKRYNIEPEKVHAIYWGVDREIFKVPQNKNIVCSNVANRISCSRPFFLAVACSTGRKNTPRLLEAYAQMIPSDPRNDLVLVWNPPADIRDRYNGKGYAGRIHFIGRQTNEELADLYAAATALVYPSLYEGFGLPVVEAMSCGTPIITSATTSLPEVGGDAAVYVDPEDVQSIRTALELFENNDTSLDGIREKSLKQSAKFSWEECARQTIDVYRLCLGV